MLLDRVQIVRAELDVFSDALDHDHRVVQRSRDGVLDCGVRGPRPGRFHRRVTAEHDLDLLIDGRADHLFDRGVQSAELGTEIGDLVRQARKVRGLEVGGLLVVG
jgi:hypothetical protein